MSRDDFDRLRAKARQLIADGKLPGSRGTPYKQFFGAPRDPAQKHRMSCVICAEDLWADDEYWYRLETSSDPRPELHAYMCFAAWWTEAAP